MAAPLQRRGSPSFRQAGGLAGRLAGRLVVCIAVASIVIAASGVVAAFVRSSSSSFKSGSSSGHFSRQRSAGQLRAGRQRVLRAAAEGEDDAASLLAQAEALRREAEAEEALLQAKKKQREAQEVAAEQQVEKEEEAKKESDKLLANARLSIAEGKLRTLESGAASTETLTAARQAVASAKAQLDELNGVAASAASPAAPTSAPVTAPGAPQPVVKMDKMGNIKNGRAQAPPGAMDVTDWNDQAVRYDKMNWFEQFECNKQLGPQGRRKLLAVRTGEGKDKVFIVPGERVRLLSDAPSFKKGFSRFSGPGKSAQLNGFSAAKDMRRGQECVVQFGYGDDTFTGLFDDGVVIDFPYEVVDGYTKE